jgi:hypothetical protein
MMKPYDVARQIRDSLAEIVELYDEVLEPQRATSGIKLPTIAVEGEKMRYAGRAMRHSPPPISAAILDARRACHVDLLHFARAVLDVCVDINGDPIRTHIDHTSVAALCDFLDTWAFPLASIDPQVGGDCARVTARHATKLLATAYPERRDWITIGDCPLDILDPAGERVTCNGQVRAWADRQFVTCPKCGREDTLDWWISHILGNPEAKPLVTTDELISIVARELNRVLTHDQIRQWATRAKIPRSGRDDKGRVLYDHRIVIALIREGKAA